jgi:hypothetical protein
MQASACTTPLMIVEWGEKGAMKRSKPGKFPLWWSQQGPCKSKTLTLPLGPACLALPALIPACSSVRHPSQPDRRQVSPCLGRQPGRKSALSAVLLEQHCTFSPRPGHPCTEHGNRQAAMLPAPPSRCSPAPEALLAARTALDSFAMQKVFRLQAGTWTPDC